MKQFLTPHDIANQVRMMRSVKADAVVLVEGDSDARVYKRFVDDDWCSVIPAFGKTNVLNTMEMLEESSLRGILAIIDSDFWKLENRKPPGADVLMTDTHDLETMIIASPALDVILQEFGSPKKMKRLGGSIRDILLKVAMPIGFVRWISSSKQENLSLRFKEMSFFTVIDTSNNTMKTNVDSLLSEVKKYSHNATFDTMEMKVKVHKLLRNREYDPWHVSRGHDMVHILT